MYLFIKRVKMIQRGNYISKVLTLLTILGSVSFFLSLNQYLNIPNASEFSIGQSAKMYRVLWYNPASNLRVTHIDALNCGFKKCKYSNCDMTLNRSYANISDAVIFDGRFIPKELSFARPDGQIWIFEAYESPISYNDAGKWWFGNTDYSFNWTMTYDKNNSDIYLPYGELLKHEEEVKRDYESIARNKNKTLLIIVSHCHTRANRQEYVNKLKEYVDVDVLGHCGKAWNCGHINRHDENCFDLLNSSYKFYLAFENAFCSQYITEKFYDNYNYDLIMLVRGGLPGQSKLMFPKGTYISTDDFKSVKDLAKFIKDLSVESYAEYLKRKSQFYSVGYLHGYQRAMCNLCERLNFQRQHAKIIPDIQAWAFGTKPCIHPNEISDVQ